MNTRDDINILGKLTFRRILNLFQLRGSYFISKVFKKNWHKGLPFSISIEPTTACNLGCPECPSGLKQFTRPTGKLDVALNRQILDQVKKTVFYVNYYFQGEPFIHPNFLDLVRDASRRRLYTSTSTNAHFINASKAREIVESGLDRLIISIDGLTQKTYEQYRVHGELDKVLKGTEAIIKAKQELKSNTPHLIFQILAVKPNEHEIPQVLKLGAEMGVDEVRIKTAQLYDYKHGNPLMPDDIEYSRYKLNEDGTYSLKYKTGNKCWRMWSSTVFTWDGKVVPCCFDKDAKHVLGTVENQSFEEIWNNSQYKSFRSAVLKNRNQIDICKNCSEGAKVWV